MVEALVQISPLFLLIGLGRVLVSIKIADTTWTKVLNAYSLNLGFPALIFWELYTSESSFFDFEEELIYNSVFIWGLFLVCLTFLPKSSNKSTFIIGLIFNNIAFLGIPIISKLYGQTTVTTTSVIASVYLFWVFTLVVFYLEKQLHPNVSFLKLSKRLIKNPLLIAVVSGVVFQSFNIVIPRIIGESITLIAQSVTPLVLISLGVFTSTISKSEWLDFKTVLVFAFTSLVLAPLLLFVYSDFSNQKIDLSIMEAAMPLAVTPFALAKDYNLNEKLLAKTIIASTVISIVTVPMWFSILQ